MKLFQSWPFLAVLLGAIPPAHADRDLVYSARYYTPVSSSKPSHFQIYRINPDGTGKTQLTHGEQDCGEPHWSPDGKWILYEQMPIKEDFYDTFYLMRPDGTGLLKLPVKGDHISTALWSPDSKSIALSYVNEVSNDKRDVDLMIYDLASRKMSKLAKAEALAWSPNGRRLLCTTGVLTLSTGVVMPELKSDEGDSRCWINNKTLASIHLNEVDEKNQAIVKTIDATSGAEQQSLALSKGSLTPQKIDYYLRIAGLLAVPDRSDSVIVVEDQGNSTARPNNVYHQVDLKTGDAKIIAENMQFLLWSPKGEMFCSAPSRDLATLGKRKDGKTVQVWVSLLQLYAADGKKLRVITSGTVWVRDCDWRRDRR